VQTWVGLGPGMYDDRKAAKMKCCEKCLEISPSCTWILLQLQSYIIFLLTKTIISYKLVAETIVCFNIYKQTFLPIILKLLRFCNVKVAFHIVLVWPPGTREPTTR